MADTADLAWRRSARCDSGTCVEVATDADRVYLRNGGDPDGLVLSFDRAVWEDFLAYLKADRTAS
jgi:hypothetical protein